MDEDLKPLFDRLTRLQKGVCLGVLEGKTQRQAYKDAGGIAKSDEVADSCASELLSNPKVKEFMEAAQGKALDNAIMTKAEALRSLSNVARGNIADLVDFSTVTLETADGPVKQTVWSLKDGVELDRDKMALFSELATSRDGFKFKLRSQDQAKKQLADMLGWNAPTKVANTDTEGNDVESSLIEKARTILCALDLVSRTKESNSK